MCGPTCAGRHVQALYHHPNRPGNQISRRARAWGTPTHLSRKYLLETAIAPLVVRVGNDFDQPCWQARVGANWCAGWAFGHSCAGYHPAHRPREESTATAGPAAEPRRRRIATALGRCRIGPSKEGNAILPLEPRAIEARTTTLAPGASWRATAYPAMVLVALLALSTASTAPETAYAAPARPALTTATTATASDGIRLGEMTTALALHHVQAAAVARQHATVAAPPAVPAPAAHSAVQLAYVPAQPAAPSDTTSQPCHSADMFLAQMSAWAVPPSCYGAIYTPNPADYAARYGFGYCDWWPEVLHPTQPDLLSGTEYHRGTVPVPGAVVYEASNVQGASPDGHYAQVVAVAPGGYWLLITEMNFTWRGGGFGKVDYRYIHVGPGITFIYP